MEATFRTRSIVLATGVEWRRLELDSVHRLVGSGVYYGAARSDAGPAQGNEVFLIGAGNSAGQAAIFFSSHARSVTLLVRGESLAASMSEYLIEQIATKANIRVETRSEVVAVHGDEQLEAMEVIDRRAGTTSRRETSALFVLIGAEAATDWLAPEIARDEHGFVLTGADAMEGHWNPDRERFALETSVPGTFAVGDVRSRIGEARGSGRRRGRHRDHLRSSLPPALLLPSPICRPSALSRSSYAGPGSGHEAPY
jgi:thioredoxin reductase (NADPH)